MNSIFQRLRHNWQTTPFFQSWFPKEIRLIYKVVDYQENTKYFSTPEKVVRFIYSNSEQYQHVVDYIESDGPTKVKRLALSTGEFVFVTKIEVE